MSLLLSSYDPCYADVDLLRMSLDSRVSFTRSSSKTYFDATGTLKTASSNTSTLEYDMSMLTLLGRSFWTGATNVCLRSFNLSAAAWTRTSCSAAVNATGIDGTANSASTVTASGANATVKQAVTGANGPWTFSVYLQRSTGSGTIQLTLDSGATWTTVTPPTGSFQRFAITQTLTNPTVGIRIVTNTDVILVDGSQLETGSVATPYIKTVTTSVARSADVCSISSLSSLQFNSTTGALMANAYAGAGDGVVFRIDDGSANNYLGIQRTSGHAHALCVASGSTVADLDLGAWTAGTSAKIAFAFAASDFAASINGGTPVTQASGALPSGLTTGRLGMDSAGANFLNATALAARVYARRLPNAVLQQITT